MFNLAIIQGADSTYRPGWSKSLPNRARVLEPAAKFRAATGNWAGYDT